MEKRFQAVVVNKQEDRFSLQVEKIKVDDLHSGEVLIQVHYSSINYKDGLATTPNGKIVRSYPHIPGIDLAGVVISSEDPRFDKGDLVIATSYEMGVSHSGGFSEYARVKADWVVPLPDGLSLKEAMIIGTAGLTAALSVQRLEENGLTPESGPVLVTGATGGVGSIGVAILAKRGYTVIASTGKEEAAKYLTMLGAAQVIHRDDVYNKDKIKALDKQLWAAAVDPVGGEALASIISKIKYGGSVAVSGLAGGGNVPTSVFPFILRGINLLGIDSVYYPMEQREKLWNRLADDFKPSNLSEIIAKEITLSELPEVAPTILKGTIRGRIIVKVRET